MVALTADRNTPAALGDVREGSAGASQLIYAGAIVMRNAAGDLLKGATATGAFGVGRAEERVDNSTGSAGDRTVRYRPGVFRFANSSGGDQIAKDDIGKVAWIVDDQTVAATSGSSTRSRAGVIDHVDDLGVWVRFDEALTRVAAV